MDVNIDLIMKLKTELELEISKNVESFEKETGFSVTIVGYRVDFEKNELKKLFLTNVENGKIKISH